MRSFALPFSVLALGLASAQQNPSCQADSCYRNLIDPRFAAEAVAFCPRFLSGTTSTASAIPTNFNNCAGNVMAVSSACSCITSSQTSTTTKASSTSSIVVPGTNSTSRAPGITTAKPPVTTITTKPRITATTTEAAKSTTATDTNDECKDFDDNWEDSDDDCDDSDDDCDEFGGGYGNSTSTVGLTTSTITAITTRTITSCPPTLTACPSGYHRVTTETIVSTTVCPVSKVPSGSKPPTVTKTSQSKLPVLAPTGMPISSTSVLGTVTIRTSSKPTTTSRPVTAGAGRVAGGIQGVAVIVGLVAAGL